jgi:hypothetical protein
MPKPFPAVSAVCLDRHEDTDALRAYARRHLLGRSGEGEPPQDLQLLEQTGKLVTPQPSPDDRSHAMRAPAPDTLIPRSDFRIVMRISE